jgi:hypothetical protein
MGNQNVRHWYNFVVPERSLRNFSSEVLGAIREPKILADQMAPERNSPYAVDVCFASDSPGTPPRIRKLMKKYDGVNVYHLVKSGQTKIIEPSITTIILN